MKYGILFFLVSTLLCTYAIASGRWSLLCLWPALSFAVVSVAYFRFGHRVFGKKPDGSISLVSVTLLLPYLLFVWTVWHIIRFVSRESPSSYLADGIIIGRRLLSHELPQGVDTVAGLVEQTPVDSGERRRRLACSDP